MVELDENQFSRGEHQTRASHAVDRATVIGRSVSGIEEVSVDALYTRIDWLVGIGLSVVGFLGFLPDTPSAAPPKSASAEDSVTQSESVGRPIAAQQLRVGLPSHGGAENDRPGWNG